MGDFWSGETDYDRRSKQRAEEKAADDRGTYNTQIKPIYDKYLTNPGGQFTVSGDNATQTHVANNLSQVGAMTGQNIFQVGQQQQDYLGSLQSRRNGDDAVANAMRAGRNRNLANVGRSFAGRGVAGGVAAAGMNSATNTADTEINSQMQKNARQNDQDLWNYVKRNQRVTGEALAGGADQGLADAIDTATGEGMFGTVICTELHRQGIMSKELYAEDVLFGKMVEKEFPAIMAGYRVLAAPIVFGMKRSKFFTKMIAPFGMSWARSMAGEPELLGSAILYFGAPICGLVGLFLPKKVVHV
jgi:hypothetical protein